jgi:hypothetical protein
MSIAATVIVPTHDHGPTLRFSLASALAQTVADIEVIVVGDGVPEVTRDIVAELARKDDRLRLVEHPKGPRHGEPYRHEALAHARGEIVCYLSDDDLWFPEHIETVRVALATADFAGAQSVHVMADGELRIWPSDLSVNWFREQMLAGAANFVPLSCAAHTLEQYRRLAQGWTPAPESSASDVFMWRKFLRAPGVRARSTTRVTVIHLPSSGRPDVPPEARAAELERWARDVADPAWRAAFPAEVLEVLLRQSAAAQAAAATALSTRTWRVRNWLLGAPALGAAARALARRGVGRAKER